MDDAVSVPEAHFHALPNTADTTGTVSKHRRSQEVGVTNEAEAGSESSSMTSSEDFEMDDIDSGRGLEDDEETGLTSNLRHQRTRRKRKNTAMDERIAPNVDMKKEEDRLTNRTVWTTILINAVLVALWYAFSISISVYNKWMFKDEDGEEKIVFPFPLFTTCVHMIVQFTLASLVLLLLPQFRPRRGHIHDPHSFHNNQSNRASSPPPADKPLMTKWFYATRIGPCGAATGLDIGLGNMSLKFISLTFYTMCKSSVLGFVLLFAFLFRLEKPSWKLAAIIATMTAGVVMMVAGETAFDTRGFFLVMSAAASSGFRWSLTQILLLRNPATSNPFSSIFFLAPVMFLTLFILAIPVEGLFAVSGAFSALVSEKGIILSLGILLFPGSLAFLMTASEFALLQRTSVVTLSICGIFKEVLTISTASLVFQDALTPINASGLIVTIATIAYYNYLKMKKMREEARKEAHLVVEQEYAPVLAVDPEEERANRHANGKAARPRSNTNDLINASLSINVNGQPARPVRNESPTRVSPVKRPEDLD